MTTPGRVAARFFRRAQELTGSQSPHMCGTLYHAHGATYSYKEAFAIYVGVAAMGEWACRVRAGWYRPQAQPDRTIIVHDEMSRTKGGA